MNNVEHKHVTSDNLDEAISAAINKFVNGKIDESYPTWPDPYSVQFALARVYSIYATYTVASTATPNPRMILNGKAILQGKMIIQ